MHLRSQSGRAIRAAVHRQIVTATVAVAVLSSCSGGSKQSVTRVVEPPVSAIQLTVLGSGAGSGRVTSVPGGIDCTVTAGTASGACAALYAPNTTVTLQAAADSTSVFVSYAGDCTVSVCQLRMSAPRVVGASFAPGTPTTPPQPNVPPGATQQVLSLSASVASRGVGTITSTPAGISCAVSDVTASGTCSASFATGTVVTLTQVPGAQSIFQGWGGDCTGNPCQVTMAVPRTAEVTYRVPAGGVVSVTGSGTGSGVITSAPSGILCTVTAGVASGNCSATFAAGTSVVLTAAGTGNGSFDGFSGACTGAGCSLAIASGVTSTVSAAFTAPPQRLTVIPGAGSAGAGVITSTPAGISCVISNTSASGTCSTLFPMNTIVTLQQQANGNAVFAQWGGDCAGNPCQVEMSQARTAQAVFQTQVVTVAGGGTGTGVVTSAPAGITCTITAGVVGGTCSATFPPNTIVTLTATPAGISTFSGYTGACVDTTCALTMVPGTTANVTAQFLAPPTVTLTAATGSQGGGTITSTPAGVSCTLSGVAASGSCTKSYALGSSVTLTQSPAPGSVFMNWAGACSGSDTCQLQLTQSRSVQALYRLAVPGSVTIMSGTGIGNGSVSSSPGGIACAINNTVKSGICRAIFPVGSTVTLLPVANAGSRFAGFSGSCSGTTCVMTVPENGDLTVTANFIP